MTSLFDAPARAFLLQASDQAQMAAEWERMENNELAFNGTLTPAHFASAMLPENANKNRYANVCPYEASRVRLLGKSSSLGSAPSSEDYVNANWVCIAGLCPRTVADDRAEDVLRRKATPGEYCSCCRYIAAQAPLPNTNDDFFRMMYDYSTRVIVMLTDWEEGGIQKAANYLPTPDYPAFTVCTGTQFEMVVSLISEEVVGKPDGSGGATNMSNGCYVHRVFTLSRSTDTEPRTIDHFQYLGWADYGVGDTELVLQMIDDVDVVLDAAVKPGLPEPNQLVHCSAGVGRTGVWIAVRTLLHHLRSCRQANTEPWLGIDVVLENMRTQRNGMVQTWEQYEFVVQTIAHILRDMKVADAAPPTAVDSRMEVVVPAPSVSTTSKPSSTTASEPRPAPQPAPQPVPKPAPKPAPQLATKSAPQSAPKSAPQPAPKSASHAPKPALKPAPKPAPKLAPKPALKSSTPSVPSRTEEQPSRESFKNSAQESAVQQPRVTQQPGRTSTPTVERNFSGTRLSGALDALLEELDSESPSHALRSDSMESSGTKINDLLSEMLSVAAEEDKRRAQGTYSSRSTPVSLSHDVDDDGASTVMLRADLDASASKPAAKTEAIPSVVPDSEDDDDILIADLRDGLSSDVGKAPLPDSDNLDDVVAELQNELESFSSSGVQSGRTAVAKPFPKPVVRQPAESSKPRQEPKVITPKLGDSTPTLVGITNPKRSASATTQPAQKMGIRARQPSPTAAALATEAAQAATAAKQRRPPTDSAQVQPAKVFIPPKPALATRPGESSSINAPASPVAKADASNVPVLVASNETDANGVQDSSSAVESTVHPSVVSELNAGDASAARPAAIANVGNVSDSENSVASSAPMPAVPAVSVAPQQKSATSSLAANPRYQMLVQKRTAAEENGNHALAAMLTQQIAMLRDAALGLTTATSWFRPPASSPVSFDEASGRQENCVDEDVAYRPPAKVEIDKRQALLDALEARKDRVVGDEDQVHSNKLSFLSSGIVGANGSVSAAVKKPERTTLAADRIGAGTQLDVLRERLERVQREADDLNVKIPELQKHLDEAQETHQPEASRAASMALQMAKINLQRRQVDIDKLSKGIQHAEQILKARMALHMNQPTAPPNQGNFVDRPDATSPSTFAGTTTLAASAETTTATQPGGVAKRKFLAALAELERRKKVHIQSEQYMEAEDVRKKIELLKARWQELHGESVDA